MVEECGVARRLPQLRVSIRRADYWLVEDDRHPQRVGGEAQFQSAGRIIGWLKRVTVAASPLLLVFQSAGRIIGWLKSTRLILSYRIYTVSIRRADYWLVEGTPLRASACIDLRFQSAGRIIGWLKDGDYTWRPW